MENNTKQLEEKILEFYNELKSASKINSYSKTNEQLEASYWLTKFIKHFNIKDNKIEV